MEWIKECAGPAAITLLFSLPMASYIEKCNLFYAEPLTVDTAQKDYTHHLPISYGSNCRVERNLLNRISKKQEKEIEG